jgi:hypothetical protein
MKDEKCGTTERIWNGTRRGKVVVSSFYRITCNWRVPVLIVACYILYCHMTVTTHWGSSWKSILFDADFSYIQCLQVFTFIQNHFLDSCSLVPQHSVVIDIVPCCDEVTW